MAGAGIRLAIYLLFFLLPLLFKILLSLKYFAKAPLFMNFFFQPFRGVNAHILTHAMFVQRGNNIVTNCGNLITLIVTPFKILHLLSCTSPALANLFCL